MLYILTVITLVHSTSRLRGLGRQGLKQLPKITPQQVTLVQYKNRAKV